MTGRFASKDALTGALTKQKIVAGNTDLAAAIADTCEVIEVPAGTRIIQQGGDDDEVYLIIAGSFDIVVNEKTIARRIANDHIGEMAAILPLQRRAAAVVAHEDSVVVRLSNTRVGELGDRFSQIWRFFALELAHRLEQRNAAATAANETVRIFIMASSPASKIARALQKQCEGNHFKVILWAEGAFGAGGYAIDRLEEALDQSDIAIAVVEPHEKSSSQAHVIFELGFFMGRLGRHRTFLVEPRTEEMQLPPELAGIGILSYNPKEEAEQAVGASCDQLRRAIHELGPNR